LERLVLHFGSRNAMDIEGLGEVVVEELVRRKLIHDVADLYRLTDQALVGLPLFAQKKADKLLEMIRRSRARGLARLLYGLGIRHVGEKAAMSLAGHFGSMAGLMQADDAALQGVPGIGPIVAQAATHFFRQPQTRALINALKQADVEMEEEVRSGPRPLADRTFVFTGELAAWSRPEAEALIRRLGGTASSSVSRKTDYVVIGTDPGSKFGKAKQLGVRILDETQFRNLIRQTS
jgi:DNA ligase (NAD+)